MKRIGNLFLQICDSYNIEIADLNARKHKKVKWGIYKHDKHREEENKKLQESFLNLTYKTSEYTTFKVYEPKERIIFRLPYYPDRIAHHAIMNVMEPIWTKLFIKNTYSCIKGRGIHKLVKDLKEALKDKDNTKYCLKIDILKFYPSVNHDILYSIIQKKIKDKKLLKLLKEIIYSANGVPIGNYLSLFFANIYLTYFDHWIKEDVKCKYYFRYADDIVILSNSKLFLHNILIAMKLYLKLNLRLNIKLNYLVFPVDCRGIDYVGYKFFHTHIMLRKSIKSKINKLLCKYVYNKIDIYDLKNKMSAYFGWLKFCNSKHLLTKIKDITALNYSNWNGLRVKITSCYNKNIHIIEVIKYNRYFKINSVYKNKSVYIKSINESLLRLLNRFKFPVNFKIKKYETKLNHK